MPDIEIYTQDFCPYCARALSLLRKKGVEFKEDSRAEWLLRACRLHPAVRRRYLGAANFHQWRLHRRVGRAGRTGTRRPAGCVAQPMIHYQLRCDSEHEFDGWFRDSAGFDQQAERGLISCPVCAGTKINRALMAPRLARKGRIIEAEPEAAPAAVPAVQAAGMMPDSVRAALNRLRTEVEKNCDYVGKDFAQAARKIHNGEAEPRGIYGETTQAEAEALADDGIDVSTIPWLPKADS